MKRKRKIRGLLSLLLSIVLLTAFATPAFAWYDNYFDTPENLLSNPGFEEQDDDWEFPTANTYPITEDYAHSGRFSAYVTGSAQKTVQLPEAGRYVLYAYIMDFTDDYSRNTTLKLTAEDNSWEQEISVVPNAEWHYVSLVFAVNEPMEALLTISAHPDNRDGFVLDDTGLVRTDEEPDYDELSDNMIADPGLEEKSPQWVTEGDSAVISTDGSVFHFAYEGKNCIGLQPTAFDGEYGCVRQNIILPEPGLYEFSVMAMSVAFGTETKLEIPNVKLETEYGEITAKATPIEEYLELSFTFAAPTASEAVLKLQAQGDLLMIMDNLKLVKVGDLPEFPSVQPTPNPYDPNPAPEPEPSLLKNSGFELGLDNWTERGSPCAFTTSAQAKTGVNSAYFGYFTLQGMQNYLEQTYVSSKKGTYTLSAYVKTDSSLSGAGAMLLLEAWDANGHLLSTAASSAVSDSGGGWAQLRVALDVPAGVHHITAKAGGVYCTGAFYMDDVILTCKA